MTAIILAIVLAGALIVGWRKGAIRQIGSITAVVVALIAARILGPTAEELVRGFVGADAPGQSSWSDYSLNIISYALVFGIVWGVVRALAGMLHEAIRIVHLGIVDKAGGAVFLAAKWMLVASIAINIVKIVQPDGGILPSEAGWQTSLVNGVAEFAPWLWGCLAPQFNLPPSPGVIS